MTSFVKRFETSDHCSHHFTSWEFSSAYRYSSLCSSFPWGRMKNVFLFCSWYIYTQGFCEMSVQCFCQNSTAIVQQPLFITFGFTRRSESWIHLCHGLFLICYFQFCITMQMTSGPQITLNNSCSALLLYERAEFMGHIPCKILDWSFYSHIFFSQTVGTDPSFNHNIVRSQVKQKKKSGKLKQCNR